MSVRRDERSVTPHSQPSRSMEHCRAMRQLLTLAPPVADHRFARQAFTIEEPTIDSRSQSHIFGLVSNSRTKLASRSGLALRARAAIYLLAFTGPCVVRRDVRRPGASLAERRGSSLRRQHEKTQNE